jgi:DMSO/TMAO reductase YedYZ molybdopterin-dependent catalytic subunit
MLSVLTMRSGTRAAAAAAAAAVATVAAAAAAAAAMAAAAVGEEAVVEEAVAAVEAHEEEGAVEEDRVVPDIEPVLECGSSLPDTSSRSDPQWTGWLRRTPSIERGPRT